jgi:hypothetical protein
MEDLGEGEDGKELASEVVHDKALVSAEAACVHNGLVVEGLVVGKGGRRGKIRPLSVEMRNGK